MIAVAVKQDRTLNSTAEEFYAKHGSIDAALDDVVAIVIADPFLTREAVRYACRHALTVAQGAVRFRVYHGATIHQRSAAIVATNTVSPEYHSRRVEALGKENLLNFPLRDGTPLRLATKEQIQRSAHYYLLLGRDETIKGRWLTYVACGMSAGERGGQRYKAEDLKRLKDKAIQATGADQSE